ncbi:MAG: AbiJ-NTD4 domain-containing protein [Candidatus Auribacterota bacterium]
MPSFSQRQGITLLQKKIQKESMDEDLRIGLWNVFYSYIFSHWQRTPTYGYPKQETREINFFVAFIWTKFFKECADTVPEYLRIASIIKENFIKNEWNQVFDIVEFIMNYCNYFVSSFCDKKQLSFAINKTLETENSAYRLINDEIVAITDDVEINAIKEGLSQRNDAVREHLSRALELLSDRKNSDFRNSMKESISAVEAACQKITGNDKATLRDCLNKLKSGHVHPALKQAFQKLYAYTNDGDGIRHALNDDSNELSYSDAKYMLVSCSAFINYLIVQQSE